MGFSVTFRWTHFFLTNYNFKMEIKFCMCLLDTYLWKVLRNNTIICGLQKNDKVFKSTIILGFLLFEEMQIFILSFFYRPHTIVC
jgi:hypothetical protein